MRTAILALILLLSSSALGAAEALHATGTASGDFVFRFDPTFVSAEIDGLIQLSGSVELDGCERSFELEGTVVGTGRGRLDDLSVAAWIAVEAQGFSETGEAIALRGGIDITQLDTMMAQSTSGAGEGRFYFFLTIAEGNWIAEGPATGSMAGEYVVPEDPSTMQLRGTATFSLVGTTKPWASEAVPYPEGMPPPDEWSQELLDLFDVPPAPDVDGTGED